MTQPIVRSHERMDYKRCPKKWYWKWRLGLVPKAISFGALDLGTWVHVAFSNWYGKGKRRHGALISRFDHASGVAIEEAQRNGAPEFALAKAEELAALGSGMMIAYEKHYGKDPGIDVIQAEIPLEFTFSDPDWHGPEKVIAIHRLKPDLVYRDTNHDIFLMEHKTAAQIRTGHLVIDDQARPYGVLADRALRNAGIISAKERVKGIMYNYLRKGQADDREKNSQGQALNKDGSISKRQPTPLFVRHPVYLTRAAKQQTLWRLLRETVEITELTRAIRAKEVDPATLKKTPHHSCPRTCDYFSICVAEEEGTNIRDMQRLMFVRKDPYEYETTDEPAGFEMG
jgi:hypothetical protein